MERAKRIEWLDVARGIGILLVILGHSSVGARTKAVLYAFHMPLFFLLAGRTTNPGKHAHDFIGLVRAKFRRLIVPYLVCAPAFYLWWYAVARHYGEDAVRGVAPTTPLVGMLYANGAGDWLLPNIVLWFLPALFCAELALWVAFRVAGGTRQQAPWPVARELTAVTFLALLGYAVGRLVLLPWSADVALVALPFLYAGVVLGRGDRGREGAPFLHGPWLVVAVAAVAAAVLVNGPVDMAQRRLHVLPIFYVGALAGSLIVLQGSLVLARLPAVRRPLAYLGRESLLILVFHLLAFQLLSAIAVFALSLRMEALHASGVYWLAQVPFAVLFSLTAAAVVKRIPGVGGVFYPSSGTHPAARLDAPDLARRPPSSGASGGRDGDSQRVVP